MDLTCTPSQSTFPIGTGLRFNKMPSHQELAEWGRRRVREGLRKDGFFHTHLLVIKRCVDDDDPTGPGFGHSVLFDLDDQMADLDQRPRMWNAIRRVVRVTATEMTMVMSETWSALSRRPNRDDLPKDLSTHPDRVENVLIVVETPQQMLLERYDILRDKRGRPRLGAMVTESFGEEAKVDWSKSNMLRLLYQVGT